MNRMNIGCPKEIKNGEFRVGLLPALVRDLTGTGHRVTVQTQAGAAVGYSDEDYAHAGALIASTAEQVFASADLIVKVKEPQPQECEKLKAGQVLFAYLHLAADRNLTLRLLASGCTVIAYETIENSQGQLPLLAPMSQVAGRLAVHAAVRCLEKPFGGPGLLLSGVPGVRPARVLIVGGGVVGSNALVLAAGLGADVTVADVSLQRLQEIDARYAGRVKTVHASASIIEAEAGQSDVIIGAVLVPGEPAPKVLRKSALKRLRPGTVLIDVAIDQGGCFETSHPTTHSEPTYVEDGIIHYCVANMPGAVPRTSAHALANATAPYVKQLAEHGVSGALLGDAGFLKGLTLSKGLVANSAIASALDLPHVDPLKAAASIGASSGSRGMTADLQCT